MTTKSRKISKKVKKLLKKGYSRKQAVAIAYNYYNKGCLGPKGGLKTRCREKRKTRKSRSCKHGKLKRPVRTKKGGKRRCKRKFKMFNVDELSDEIKNKNCGIINTRANCNDEEHCYWFGSKQPLVGLGNRKGKGCLNINQALSSDLERIYHDAFKYEIFSRINTGATLTSSDSRRIMRRIVKKTNTLAKELTEKIQVFLIDYLNYIRVSILSSIKRPNLRVEDLRRLDMLSIVTQKVRKFLDINVRNQNSPFKIFEKFYDVLGSWLVSFIIDFIVNFNYYHKDVRGWSMVETRTPRGGRLAVPREFIDIFKKINFSFSNITNEDYNFIDKTYEWFNEKDIQTKFKLAKALYNDFPKDIIYWTLQDATNFVNIVNTVLSNNRPEINEVRDNIWFFEAGRPYYEGELGEQGMMGLLGQIVTDIRNFVLFKIDLNGITVHDYEYYLKNFHGYQNKNMLKKEIINPSTIPRDEQIQIANEIRERFSSYKNKWEGIINRFFVNPADGLRLLDILYIDNPDGFGYILNEQEVPGTGNLELLEDFVDTVQKRINEIQNAIKVLVEKGIEPSIGLNQLSTDFNDYLYFGFPLSKEHMMESSQWIAQSGPQIDIQPDTDETLTKKHLPFNIKKIILTYFLGGAGLGLPVTRTGLREELQKRISRGAIRGGEELLNCRIPPNPSDSCRENIDLVTGDYIVDEDSILESNPKYKKLKTKLKVFEDKLQDFTTNLQGAIRSRNIPLVQKIDREKTKYLEKNETEISKLKIQIEKIRIDTKFSIPDNELNNYVQFIDSNDCISKESYNSLPFISDTSNKKRNPYTRKESYCGDPISIRESLTQINPLSRSDSSGSVENWNPFEGNSSDEELDESNPFRFKMRSRYKL